MRGSKKKGGKAEVCMIKSGHNRGYRMQVKYQENSIFRRKEDSGETKTRRKKQDPMIKHEIDNIKFHLKTCHDLTWVKKYGTVFSVIDATGSGCISFGVADENGRDRYFIKIAGVDTVDAEISPAESVETLKNAAE